MGLGVACLPHQCSPPPISRTRGGKQLEDGRDKSHSRLCRRSSWQVLMQAAFVSSFFAMFTTRRSGSFLRYPPPGRITTPRLFLSLVLVEKSISFTSTRVILHSNPFPLSIFASLDPTDISRLTALARRRPSLDPVC